MVQILYTSGTTSDPKGAMHTHRSLLTEYGACQYHLDIRADDRSLAALPLYHSAQMHVFTMPMLLTGGYSRLIHTPTPEAILSLLAEERLNAFFAPPTVWISLLRHPAFDEDRLRHMTKLYYGASIMPAQVVDELGRRLPDAGLYNCYGQSEIAPLATVLLPDEHGARAHLRRSSAEHGADPHCRPADRTGLPTRGAGGNRPPLPPAHGRILG